MYGNAAGTGSLNWYQQFHPTVPEAQRVTGEVLHINTDLSPLDEVWDYWGNRMSPAMIALYTSPNDYSDQSVGRYPPPSRPLPQVSSVQSAPPMHDPNPYWPVRAILQEPAHQLYTH